MSAQEFSVEVQGEDIVVTYRAQATGWSMGARQMKSLAAA
jgi:hypothetical protein